MYLIKIINFYYSCYHVVVVGEWIGKINKKKFTYTIGKDELCILKSGFSIIMHV